MTFKAWRSPLFIKLMNDPTGKEALREWLKDGKSFKFEYKGKTYKIGGK